MEIDCSDNSPELSGGPKVDLPKKSKKKIAELRKELTEKVPVDSKVPPSPSQVSELTEAGDAYEKYFGFPRASVPPSVVEIGDRIMEAGKMHEMRTASSNGFPALGIIYEYPGDLGIKLVVVELPEGVDPMVIAKALKWLLAGKIVPAKVRDEAPERFSTMVPFKPTDLVDRPVLAAHKAIVKKELNDTYGASIASNKQTIGVLRDQVQRAATEVRA